MRAYITLLSNDKYLPGVIALKRALDEVNSKYPLYCVLSQSVGSDLQHKIESLGINCIRLTKTAINETLNQDGENFSHWSYTFDKLQVWGLTEFDKIIFLDSDMLVLRNLDHLFNKEAFSAVAAGYSSCLREDWLYLNSGLMVIEPNKKVEQSLLELAPFVISEFRSRGETVGDQDVIKRYCEGWKDNLTLHLDEGYNLFADYLSYYIREWGYSWNGKKGKPIYVIHFIGKNKPWMRKSLRNWCWLFKALLVNPYYILAYIKYRTFFKLRNEQ